MTRMLAPLVPCTAPGCMVMYRPHWMRRGACSSACIEKLRQLQGLAPKDPGVLLHPSWQGIRP